MNILGLHACFTAQSHDPSAALLMEGSTIAAIEEERLNRIKTSVGFFPYKSVEACLEVGRIKLRDIDRVAADGVSFPYLREKIAKCLKHKFGFCPPIQLVHHAKAHVAGAFLSSGFEKSLVVSVDGLGDRVSSLVVVAEKKRGIAKFRELYRADKTVSLGNFYTALTNYLGFKSVEGEYKVMGMAAYGKPRFNLPAGCDLILFLGRSSGKHPKPIMISESTRQCTRLFITKKKSSELRESGDPCLDSGAFARSILTWRRAFNRCSKKPI